MSDKRTAGELLFEDYLASQGITTFEFEKVWSGIPTQPDYTVTLNGQSLLFDVKDFDFELRQPGQVYFDNPADRVRKKIERVRTQFKYFKDKPCALVLYTHDPLVELTEWTTMFGAMYGDFGMTMLVDTQSGSVVPGSEEQTFLSGGKMFRLESLKPQNQTVSALITLRYVHLGPKRYRQLFRTSLRTGEPMPEIDFDKEEKHLGVIVWENAYARIPFPRGLFRGPYDERWGVEDEFVKRIFAGSEVLTIESLDESE